MSAVARNMTAIVALLLVELGAAAEEATTNSRAQGHEAIRVIDVVIVSTNRVTIGSNTMSVVAATNVIARDTVDIVAVHGSLDGDASARRQSSAVAKLARAGVPMVFVERDGEYLWRERSGADGVRTVKIGTDQFADLRRFWRTGMDGAGASSGPVLRMNVDWDTAAGSYKLTRIDLGLFGKRVWLIHEQSDSDGTADNIGIQLKKEW